MQGPSVVYAVDFGFNVNSTADQNAQAINAAIASLPPIDVNGLHGGTIQLPPGQFSISEVIIPEYVWLRGAGQRATALNYDGSKTCLTLGSATPTPRSSSLGRLRYGCSVTDLSIILWNITAPTGQSRTGAIELIETAGAVVARVYIMIGASVNAGQRLYNIGVAINGGYQSSFFNHIESVICNHIPIGYRLLADGDGQSTESVNQTTQNLFLNCSANGDSGECTIGLCIDGGQGDGTVWISGNIEHCTRAVYLDNGTELDPSHPDPCRPKQLDSTARGALSITMIGTRLEGNVYDVFSEGNAWASTFIGLNSDSDPAHNEYMKVTDGGQIHTFIGCTIRSATRQACINRSAAATKGRMLRYTWTGGTISPDIQIANEFTIDIASIPLAATAIIVAPLAAPIPSGGTPPTDGQIMRIMIRNQTGAALPKHPFDGTVFKLGDWAQLLAGYSRSISFRYQQANENEQPCWVEVNRSGDNIPF